MATMIAEKFKDDWHAKMAALLNEDVADDDSAANKAAQISLLQRVVPYWFMRPFRSRDGGAVDQGVQNEGEVIRVLRRKIKELSRGEYAIHGEVEEFGLLAKRDHPYCTSSPDGVFALKKWNITDKKYDELLDKMVDQGADSLTELEKKKLEEYSKSI